MNYAKLLNVSSLHSLDGKLCFHLLKLCKELSTLYVLLCVISTTLPRYDLRLQWQPPVIRDQIHMHQL